MITQVPFIDRETELTLIDQAIRAQNTRRIIGVQAAGGVGKTRLLQEVQRLYKNTDIGRELNLFVADDILDFDDRANLIAQNVGRRIAQMLGAQAFRPYLRGLLDYQKLEKAGVHYARLQEAEQLNNQAFVQCFNQVTKKQRVILLLDTIEKLSPNTTYLFEWIKQTQNVVWVIVGRNKSEILKWICSEQSEELLFLELKDLSPEASRKYLQAKQRLLHIALEPDLADKLLVLAQGRPILIDLAVELRTQRNLSDWLAVVNAPSLEKLSVDEKAQKRQEFECDLVLSVAETRDPIDWLILAMAHVYPLDADILGELLDLPPTDAEALFQEAQRYVFVKQLPDGRITLHDEMWRMVRAYVWPEVDPDNDRRQEYSKIAVKYFETQEQSLKAQIAQLLESQEPQAPQSSQEELELNNSIHRQTLERELGVVQESLLVHTLFIDITNGIDVFARLFDEATHAYTFDRREMFYKQIQAYNFDKVLPEHKYIFNSRKIRYLNDVGQFDEAQALATGMLSGELKTDHRLDILTLSGRSYELSHDLFNALKQYEKALEICEHYPELARWKGTALSNLGRVTREMRRSDEAFAYYKEALFIAEDPAQIAAILNSMGYVWALQGRYRGALEYCNKALSIYKTLQQERAIGTTLTTIGEVYRNQGHYEQAINYYNQARGYFERENDLIWLARLYSFRGAVYRLQSNFPKAEVDLRKSLSYNIKAVQPWTYHVLGCVYWNQKQWDAAEAQFRTSDQLAQEIHDIRSQVNNLVGYAELYFDRWVAFDRKDPQYPAQIWLKAQELEDLLEQGYGFEHHRGRMQRTMADVWFYERDYDKAFEAYKEALTLLGSRLGGYARLNDFQDEVNWLAGRILELATIGEPQRALAWCQTFREHWGNAKFQMMRQDLLLSMCDVCEIEIKLELKKVK